MFLIRALSTTATGREIVRERHVDALRITAGRGPTNDIVLSDMEVTLQHAVIHKTAPYRVTIQALAGTPFTVDGRSTSSASIDATVGAEVRIAGFRLVFTAGEGDEVVISVERHGLVAASAQKRDERQLFSLAGVAPSKRWAAWAGALAVLALFLAWPIWSFQHRPTKLTAEQLASASYHHADQSWSAGPLSRAHAKLEGNCTACHVKAFVSVRDESCKTCHAQVHDHADPVRLREAMAPSGIGARLRLAVANTFNRPAGRCIDCHVEHQGESMPATPQRFCADCHGDLKQRLSDTALPNVSDFGRDHPEFKPAILFKPGKDPVYQRIALDQQPIQQTGLKYPHALHLSVTNAVARMAETLGQAMPGKGLACASCHVPDGSGFKPMTMEANCQSCHSLAYAREGGAVRTLRHGDIAEAMAQLRDYYASHATAQPQGFGLARRRPGDFAADSLVATYRRAGGGEGGRADRAIRAIFSDGGACYDCHVVTPPSRPGAMDFGVAPVTIPQRYFTKGSFDHRAHAATRCEECHAARTSNDAHDVLIPRIAECRTCHSGEHPSRKAPVASNCAMCHAYHNQARPTGARARREGE
jgi:hypothetical protein